MGYYLTCWRDVYKHRVGVYHPLKRGLVGLLDSFADEGEFVQDLFRLGELRFEAGRLDEALDLFGRVLDRDPEHADATNGFGKLLVLAGEQEEAERAFAHAVAYFLTQFSTLV